MTDHSAGRPFGFMLFRFWESSTAVPQIVVNPEDVASCYPVNTRDGRGAVVVQLRDGRKLRVWSATSLKAVAEDIDEAMRERLRLRNPETAVPK
jgi:hypothetical protein